MKNPAHCVLAFACFAALSFAAVPLAHAATKCDRQQLTYIDARACAKAAESITALRQYVWRTRMIHHLVMSDYARSED